MSYPQRWMLGVTLALCIVALLTLTASAAPQSEDPEKKAILEARQAQDLIDKATEEMMRKLTELEIQYHKKKLPLFEQRNEVLKGIKGFWSRVVENHPSHESWCRGNDKAALAYLTDVVIKDLEEETDAHLLHHYRLELHFAPNAYFSNAMLWRDIRGHAHDDGQSQVSGVSWFEGRYPTDVSFFNFFEKTDAQTNAPRLENHFISEIGHIFRYEFWPNPFTYHDLPQYQELMQQHHRGDYYAAEDEEGTPYTEDHETQRPHVASEYAEGQDGAEF